MTRLDEIVAGLNESYPMYWTGPRYRVPDGDVRALVEVARKAEAAFDAYRHCTRTKDGMKRLDEAMRAMFAALAPLVGEGE
jgi:hypothetical protein